MYMKLYDENTTCCFTGMRPQKLPWGFNERDKRCVKMKKELKLYITEAINLGYDTFFTGMALGFDMICAEMIIELKKKYPQIRLIGALPCRNQSKNWSKSDKKRYDNIYYNLDAEYCKYDKYIGAECMLERNRFMVDNSRLVIALYSGGNGGTKYTMDYAKRNNKNVILLEP